MNRILARAVSLVLVFSLLAESVSAVSASPSSGSYSALSIQSQALYGRQAFSLPSVESPLQPLQQRFAKCRITQRIKDEGGEARNWPLTPALSPEGRRYFWYGLLAAGVVGAIWTATHGHPLALAGFGVFAVPASAPPNYRDLLFEELKRLAEPTVRDLDPAVFYRTQELVHSAGTLDELYAAWGDAHGNFAPAFRKFLRLYVRRLAPDYRDFVPVLTRLTNRLAKREPVASGLFASLMGALGRGNPYRRLLTEQFQEILARKREPIRVVYVTPEVLPHYKKGGLADVTWELARALNDLNAWVSIVTLLYPPYHMKPADRPPLLVNGRQVEIPVPMGEDVPLATGKEVHPALIYKSGLAAAWARSPEVYLLTDATPSRRNNLSAEPYDSRTPELKAKQTRFLAEGSLLLIRFLVSIGEMTRPDLIIAHDWPGSLVNAYLRTKYVSDAVLGGIEPGFFLHNILPGYQGPLTTTVWNIFGLTDQHLHGFTYEHASRREDGTIRLAGDSGHLNLVKAALLHAAAIWTPSRVFAQMIQTKDFGHGLDPILRLKAEEDRLVGISNGMTYDERDKLLETEKDIQRFLDAKMVAKRLLLEETGLWRHIEAGVDRRVQSADYPTEEAYRRARAEALEAELAVPVEGVIARLDVEQKGLGFYEDHRFGVEGMVQRPAGRQSRLVLLGEAIPRYSDKFVVHMEQMQRRYPQYVAFFPHFHVPLKDPERCRGLFINRPITALEHLIWAGVDFASVPSFVEPFGITGLEALDAGALLIGSTHGGPAVQIKDFRVDPEGGNGILFGEVFDPAQSGLGRLSAPYDAAGFYEAREQLLRVYFEQPDKWRRMMVNAKNTRFTWEDSAREHLRSYARLLGRQDVLENPEKDISRPTTSDRKPPLSGLKCLCVPLLPGTIIAVVVGVISAVLLVLLARIPFGWSYVIGALASLTVWARQQEWFGSFIPSPASQNSTSDPPARAPVWAMASHHGAFGTGRTTFHLPPRGLSERQADALAETLLNKGEAILAISPDESYVVRYEADAQHNRYRLRIWRDRKLVGFMDWHRDEDGFRSDYGFEPDPFALPQRHEPAFRENPRHPVSLMVDEELQRRGWGTALVSLALRIARADPASQAFRQWRVEMIDPRARAFWKTFGFKEYRYIPSYGPEEDRWGYLIDLDHDRLPPIHIHPPTQDKGFPPAGGSRGLGFLSLLLPFFKAVAPVGAWVAWIWAATVGVASRTSAHRVRSWLVVHKLAVAA
jgi:starch synthase